MAASPLKTARDRILSASTTDIQRESMEFDVLIVGGGPAGLATACRLAQLTQASGQALTICVLEKGAEVGAHIVSGALLDPCALTELFPDWQNLDAPVKTAVSGEDVVYLTSDKASIRVPDFLVPADTHNQGNYVISLADLCRWLGKQAEALGVEILAGFSAAQLLFDESGTVTGVLTGDQGVEKSGEPGPNYTPGYELRARYTVLAEGCRGHLGKEVIRRFNLDAGRTPPHYGLGIKEIWQIPAAQHKAGHVLHTLGWPLSENNATGGSFLYHLNDNQVSVGLITDLNYENAWLNPFEEFQRLKHHPVIAAVLKGGKRLSYGARALTKGGLQSLPELAFPGGVLVGDDAGFLNFLKIKGTHTAMKSGMLAAEAIAAALQHETPPAVIASYQEAFTASWLHNELHKSRNAGPALHKFGTLAGCAFSWFDQTLCKGQLPFTLRDEVPDHAALKAADHSPRITYPKPDNVLSFDRLSSVYLSNTFHEENQPAHLQLIDADTPMQFNLPQYDEPAQRYCPAGVYEVVREDGVAPRLQINAQNCVHCKTCDIKDPTQNIRWVPPEGGGGPNYSNM
jgi:electron-transferring-flavoprotein dehydrogenase